ncbi:MAG: ECF-type sigma factor [Pseudomonadaceae bacterium]|nr:ECF-type sigma factor [Pseudomonadaceae bacterium]
MEKNITKLLLDWQRGEVDAERDLWMMMHVELRQLAAHYMRGQQPGHVLQATALVNEAFLKLVDAEFRGSSKGAFMALAAKAMRSILVDQARYENREKRGGGFLQVTLSGLHDNTPSPEEILLVDEEMVKLEKIDERMARIVEMKIFGGFTYDEIAALLSVSSATVRADMKFGITWLKREMG